MEFDTIRVGYPSHTRLIYESWYKEYKTGRACEWAIMS